MSQYKLCSLCNQTLSFDFFGKDKSTRSGLKSSCKTCRNKKAKDDYTERRDYYIEYALINKDKRAENTRNWYNKNKARKLILERLRKEKNPEATRKRLRSHRQNNPEMYRNYSGKRRSLLLASKFYRVENADLKKIMRNPCLYCGEPSEHLEHILPLQRGGLHKIGNLAAACKRCNLSKGSKTIMEWRILQIKLIQAELKV